MNPRLLATPILLLPCLVAIAQAPSAGSATTSRPLNLSLPRELRQADLGAEGSDALYDPLDRKMQTRRGDGRRGGGLLPYGRGYEARQRQAASSDVPAAGGPGSPGGVGWGMAGGRGGPVGGGGRHGAVGRGR